MTHIIKLLYGTDKRNPTRELSLTDLDANIYLQENGTAPGGGQLNPLWSGRSSRFDGERKLNESRENTRLEIMYSLSADNTQHLQVVQRKISRFFMECSPNADKRKKVWLEYRWSNDGLDDLARPALGQLNHYLEVLHADVKQWPDALHSGQMVAGYVEGVSLEIVGSPYWEGLEDRAADADGLAETTDSAVKYTLDNSEVTDSFTIATWIEHRASDYVVFEYYVDSNNYVRLEWDQSDGRFEVVRSVSGTPTTYNGGAQTLSAGTKYHLTLIQDESMTVLDSYFNRLPDISTTNSTMSNGGALYFGSAASVATAANSTGLDARRVWDTNITEEQLLALYTSEVAIISAGDSIQYPLYFDTHAGDGAVRNSLGLSAGSGVIAYYPFKQSYFNIDFSGNDYHLTNDGAVIATGKIGYGAEFEKANTDTMYVPYADLGDLNFGDTDFSIDFWIKWNSTAGTGGANSRHIIDFSDGSGIVLKIVYDFLSPYADFGFSLSYDGNNTYDVSFPQSITVGQWYYVAVYHDAAGNEIGISVNGAAFETQSAGSVFSTTSANFNIGSTYSGGNSNNSFDGVIDEMGIYDYVLSTDDIASRYNSGNGNTLASLQGNYGVLYGLSGDSLASLRVEINPPTSNTDRVYYAGLLSADSDYDLEDVHYIDFNATSASSSSYSGGGYTSASATSGSGTDTTTIEAAITTPGDLQPGRYQILAHLRITAGSATTATVTPYYRIGASTAPEIYGTANSVDSNAAFLFQNLGAIDIDWSMDTLAALTFGLKFAETEATAVTPAIDFIMLMPDEPGLMVECEDSSITIASGDTLHINERRSWVTDASATGQQNYYFEFNGDALRALPYKYNYLFFINGEDNQAFTVGNSSTVKVYVTPRWALPGGMVA